MKMFCYQCQETAKGKGCTVRGVCGKNETLAQLQDLLIYTVKGVAEIVVKGKLDLNKLGPANCAVLDSLFMTITNANWDEPSFEKQILKMIATRDELGDSLPLKSLHDAATFKVSTREEMLEKAAAVGVLATVDQDVRSLRELITYGLKGMAAYAEHAKNIGTEDLDLNSFIYETLAATLDDSLTVNDLVALTLKTGEYCVKVMALLDRAHTSRFGNPAITSVNIGVRKNPAILISGHDLTDLDQLLKQTWGSGIDVYTHGEMLPAHSYPAFKRFEHLAGNYGNAWWKQSDEFASFHGPILFTTNCIVPPRSEEIRNRIFTTGSSGCPGCRHIEEDENGKKDFSEIIALAGTLPPPAEIETGSITGGFAHHQVMALADQIIEAVKSGAIKKFFVMAGCDGRMKSRRYYTEFAQKLPQNTVILTAGCAKYRYNKLKLGDINGIPRVLDAGQCNDSYSLALIALKLKEAFGLDDINQLPLAFNIAWYEQKAVTVLLALLYLGIKNIHLGPTLPAFFSPNVTRVLAEKFGLTGIGTLEADLKHFMAG